MTQSKPKDHFRAVVYVRGATNEKLYRKTVESAKRAGIKRLTNWRPGDASLYPDHIDIQRWVRERSGNRSDWETVETVQYKDVPEDQLEWKRRDAERAARRAAQTVQ